jgi:hypothetical protein
MPISSVPYDNTTDSSALAASLLCSVTQKEFGVPSDLMHTRLLTVNIKKHISINIKFIKKETRRIRGSMKKQGRAEKESVR